MFIEILPKVYYLLRQRTGLTQSELAPLLKVKRTAISKYESGKTRPSIEAQIKLLELAKCSREELTEIFCQALSEFSGRRVAIVEGQDKYRPTTFLSKSLELLDKHEMDLEPELARALHNKMQMCDLARMVFDRSRADLSELYRDCQQRIEKARVGS